MAVLRKVLYGILFVFLFMGAGQALADDQQFLEGERLSKTCASCHGTDGASPGELIPTIGGQKKGYLATALKEFAADTRPGSVMANLAKGYMLDEQQQMAAFFESKPWVNTPHAATTVVDDNLSRSCQGCHGKDGAGRGNFPRIAGQHPEYLLEALQEYKQGQRKAMTMKLVSGYDEAKLKQFADYYSALK